MFCIGEVIYFESIFKKQSKIRIIKNEGANTRRITVITSIFTILGRTRVKYAKKRCISFWEAETWQRIFGKYGDRPLKRLVEGNKMGVWWESNQPQLFNDSMSNSQNKTKKKKIQDSCKINPVQTNQHYLSEDENKN